MKTIIINIIFLVVWAIIGHYLPSITLLTTFLIYPLLFLFSGYYIKYDLPGYFVIPFNFLLLLVNDYFFRIFGGGIHDDTGRGWCELIFYITLVTSTVVMFFLSYKLSKKDNKLDKFALTCNIFITVGSLAMIYLIYMNVNIYI